jgi:hypothetical protein
MSRGSFLSGVVGGCLCTLVIVAIAFFMRSNDRSFKATALRAVATVTEHGEHVSRDSHGKLETNKFDMYEFVSASGQRVRFESLNSGMRPRRPIGAQADIVYDPSDSSDARLDDDAMSRASTLLLWCSPFGLVVAGITLLVWLRTRPQAPA